MIGTKVEHAAWGIGTITELEGHRLVVEFANQTKKFVYPDAFEKFIKAVDPDVQNEMINIINKKKAEAEEKRLKEEVERKAEAERKAAEKTARSSGKKRTPKKEVITHRIEGKRMTFFVYQGDSFEEEYRGGYIWAPTYDKGGSRPHHWARLLDVRKGDILLHSCNAHIQAISVAKDAGYAIAKPMELAAKDEWDNKGNRVDCEYVRLENPIKTSRFVDDIVRLRSTKYSAFDRYGSGNMGYLYQINRELARIFVAEAVKQNPTLADVDYINEMLSESDAD